MPMDDVVPDETSSSKPSVSVRFVLKGNKKQKLCTDHHNNHNEPNPIKAMSRSDDKMFVVDSKQRKLRIKNGVCKQEINTLPVNDNTIKVQQLDEQVVSISSVESSRPKTAVAVPPKSHYLRVRKNKKNYGEINKNGECSRPKFCVSLTKKEIQEDFYSMGMTKLPRRRPKIKRPKYIQNKMDVLFPGSTLSKITVNRYKVNK